MITFKSRKRPGLSRITRRALQLVSFGAFVLAMIGIVVVTRLPQPWQTIVGVIIGGALSLLASTVIQWFASVEQTELVESLTLDAPGIVDLPEAFKRMRWLTWATKRPGPDGKEKVTKWYHSALTPIGGTGPRFSSYTLQAPNLVGEKVTYVMTFIGLQGCVLAAITTETEPTSCVIFDTSVPDPGLFFGAAYLTDWHGERDLTLSIASTGNTPPTVKPTNTAVAAFARWVKKINWIIDDETKTFPTFDADTNSSGLP